MPSSHGWRTIALVASVLSSIWAVFQWIELVSTRAGNTPFCSVNDTLNCAAVWDLPIAVTLHNTTQVPVAGHGLIWGVLMTVLLVMARSALTPRLSAALRVVAVIGVLSIVVLGAASAMAGVLCLTCLGTYALVVVACTGAWMGTRDQPLLLPQGAAMAGVGALGLWLLCIYPGMKTPHAPVPMKLPTAPTTVAPSITPPVIKNVMFDGPATGDPIRDNLIEQFTSQVDPQTKQLISDVFNMYNNARAQKPVPMTPARSLAIGQPAAPVRITEWTDPRCPHCRDLHSTLEEIRQSVPAGLFSVDSRQFPLDGACNAGVERKSDDAYRCIAAKAAICLEGNPNAHAAITAIFSILENATVSGLKTALAPFITPAQLDACVTSPATAAKLQSDIDAALPHNLEGTPLVLINGYEFQNFPPAIYLMILTGGTMKHPTFAGFPAPRPPPSHDGHQH
jgi:protein-disulfide isomerase/uncharacterized membrane protein